MEIPEYLSYNTWTSRTAHRAIPLLVWCAENRKTIRYGQLDAELERRNLGHHVHAAAYGHPAGAIGNALQETAVELGWAIPPLNALIVGGSGLPGSGCDHYLSTFLKERKTAGLTDQERKSMAEETIELIWDFPDWRRILKRYGLKPIAGNIPILAAGGRFLPPKKGGWSNEPESEQHKKLKEWVVNHPSILKSQIRFGRGVPEWLFASADRVDVMFSHARGCVAVEVKAANSKDNDLERGIYQCVKYRALLRAELKASNEVPNGTAVLVTERALPQKHRALAKMFNVQVITVPVRRSG